MEARIQFARLELLLPIGWRCLQRRVLGRLGGGFLVGRRHDSRAQLLDGIGDGD